MKDYSQYHYIELYDMLNHINPYKYPERIQEVEKEIELRKERGEIPQRLVPEIDWTPLKFWKRKKKSLIAGTESNSA